MNKLPQRMILFLDVATRTGWCAGRPGETPEYGSKRLAPEEAPPVAIVAHSQIFIRELIETFRPNVIIAETPVFAGAMAGKTNHKTTRLLQCLPWAMAAAAYHENIFDYREKPQASIRKFILGRKPTTGKAKIEVMHAVRELGFDPQDDNASDAIAGWLFSCAEIAPDIKPAHSTPLFEHKQENMRF